MSLKLKIVWQGTAPGLAEHRLSINTFAEPLSLLLSAIRRTASNLVRDAMDQRAVLTGRLLSEAQHIDIEIQNILQGSAGIEGLVVLNYPEGTQTSLLLPDLAERATEQILDAIGKESRGIPRNAAARTYLESLPTEVHAQEYILSRNGTELSHVTLTKVALPTQLIDLPHLSETIGRVIGVGFEPGRNRVQIRSEDGTEISLSATGAFVEAALTLRGIDVRVLFVVLGDGNRRLLRIQSLSEPRVRLGVEQAVFGRWHDLLARLATE